MPRDVNSIRRKLAAITAADVAGYSRLMSLDESGTVKALSEVRTIFDQVIGEFGGCCISVQLKIEERAAGRLAGTSE